ncbi:MAG TPA: four helix bundle protein [Chitinophagaceae bacterium]|nr:four helix bundle protein [Chitinophagaceae bacterium]
MRNFKELRVWQKGFQIAVNSFKITESFPQQEKFGLSSQINRSGVSIPSNIAEGSSRISDKDYNRFIEISLGSSFELETQLLIAKEVKYVNSALINSTLELLAEEEKMLTAFSSSLSNGK